MDVFRIHGGFCARHPWEVIFVVLTATVCIVSSGLHCNSPGPKFGGAAAAAARNQPLDVVLMTLVRCVAVLYSYHKLRSLHRSHSRFALGLAGIFTVFSSFVFTCSVVNLMHSDLSDLKDALFFFLLLIDVVKACALAHWSLCCSARNAAEVAACIEQGMAVLGPTITLDTAVETLVIGIGTLSGVRRLEVLCSYGCMSALVNYIVFMTFYPACLSLVLELSGKRINAADEAADNHNGSIIKGGKWQQQVKALKQILAAEQPNPVVQRVKVIMAAGLMVVHARCRFAWTEEEENDVLDSQSLPVQDIDSDDWVLRLLSLSADQLVLLILVLALTVKFTFFDGGHEEPEQHRTKMSLSGRYSTLQDNGCALSAAPNFPATFDETSECFFSKHEISRTRPMRAISLVVGDESESEDDAFSPQMIHQEVQTESWDIPASVPCGISRSGDGSSSPSHDKETQTGTLDNIEESTAPPRSMKDCSSILETQGGMALTDEEILNLINCRIVAAHQLEKVSGDAERGVSIRRKLLSRVEHPHLASALAQVPFLQYDYSKVVGACCENVIGYTPVPLGVVGPLLVDGVRCYVPMATTEGCLVASTNRGCRALSSGVNTRLIADGMSRGPVVRLPSIARAGKLIEWLNDSSNLEIVKTSFNSTSRFAKLQKIRAQIAGRHLFLRFVAKTGDAMGMNMVSKGTEAALIKIQEVFPDVDIVSLSGNFCTDKKPAAVNWLDGRGKSVVCEAVVQSETVEKILKTSVAALVDLNITKNLMGSAMAGSLGGFNAHAANIVTAIFIATGQDPAQVVTSSNCMTLMEPWGPDGRDLYISCSMPSLEIGTVGGGTVLGAQGACLQMLGVQGSNAENPGENAARLARIVCATVLAGELSLMSALAAGHLVKSHMTHNRSSVLLATQSCSQ